MDLSTTTLCIKTIERPTFLGRLLQSIRAIYPAGRATSPPIRVADDAEDYAPARKVCLRWDALHLPLPHDVGLSAGRNALVEAATTPYVIILDDDFECFPDTDFGQLVRFVEGGIFDIAGGTVYHNGSETHYEGWMRLQGDRLEMGPRKQRTGPSRVDICYNFLAARRATLLDTRWDPALKMCEHQDFFLRCQRAGVKVGYVPDVRINHLPGHEGRYTEYRKVRAMEFYEQFKRNWGLTAIQGSPAAPAGR